ncbi:hypothetical protein [Aquimarina longa]|uniref:hypothetical protein n=1 Tax=Aquimarina longa TaxID=1080221 RepID=UPI000782BDAF|nr:hypothetical protein [Aquimarina longa]
MIELISELIVEWLIMGICTVIHSLYDWIKGKILRIPKVEVERKRLEKKWLYKKILLIKNQENGLKKGMTGIVMEIIDKKTLFVEFKDQKGGVIELNGELTFQIRINQIKLKN